MIYKTIGALGIFASCSAIGMIKSSQLGSEVKFIESIDDALLILETEISSALTPLPLAMEHAARAQPLFGRAAGYMRAGLCADEALLKTLEETECKEGEREALKSYAAGLLASDREGQIKNISLCRARIRNVLSASSEKKDKLQKVYASCGALSGIAAVIILV